MAELMEYVQTLAEKIGPRPVSTEEEHQASLFIAQELADEGLEVDIDEFTTPKGTRWPYALACALIIAGVLVSGIGLFVESIATSMLVVGLLLILAGIVIYYAEHNNHPILSKRRVTGISQNVVARYVPSSVARERRRRKVVIVSHVDTVRAQPEAMPALLQHTGLLRAIAYYDAPLVFVLTFVRALPLPLPGKADLILWIVALVCCLYLLVAMLGTMAAHFTPYIAGGNDNASGNAVMLATAKRLLNPKERERFSVERPVEPESDIPVETFAPQATGSFAPVVIDGGEARVHGEQAARDAGLVPEGATLEYDAAATRTADEQAAAADQTAAMPPMRASVADPEPQPEPAPEPEPEPQPEPEPEPEPEPRSAWAQRLAQTAAAGASAATASEPAAAQDAATSGMPSWYKAGKAKAAKDEPAGEEATYRSRFADVPLHGRAEEPAPEEPASEAAVEQPEAPAAADAAPAQADAQPAGQPAGAPAQPLAAAESVAVLDELLEEPAEDAQGTAATNVISFEAAAGQRDEAAAAGSAPDDASMGIDMNASAVLDGLLGLEDEDAGAQQAEASGAFAFDIPDDELEDLTPESADISSTGAGIASGAGSSGTFEPQTPAGAGKKGGFLRGLTSRIPVIGSAGAAADEPDADPFAPKSAAESAAEPAAAAEKPVRRKPTARNVSDDFEPTRAANAHESGMFSALKQEAPISSTYDDTPQAADPFAPRAEHAGEQADAVRPSPRMRHADSPAGGPGNTSSFPSLTGSFPALSGTMPVVSASDFGTPAPEGGYDTVADDDIDDSFLTGAGMTTEIKMPQSRLHNAMDKVGGLFGRGGSGGKRSARAEARLDEAEQWDDDDDFGWKGGGFLDESESAFAAARARARASEIRESVVSMTESDLLDKEVWFVALGASAANNRGMQNFLELHGSELRGALIVNVECVGAGELRYLELEGKGKARSADRRLQSLVKSASRELTGQDMRPQRMTWRNTDATPAMRQGLRAISIMGFSGNVPAHWHWNSDTAGVVEEDNLEYMTKLLLKIIEQS